jgi:2-isopropylmalate synthase
MTNKYSPFPLIDLPGRSWPNKAITTHPIWMSSDLRDGNQSLFEPMNVERKMQMFHLLCEIGFKEIEIAFPSASQIEFDFVRILIEGNHIPDDVTIVVLSAARAHLISRTIESLKGARRAIVHIYNATSRPFREIVFGMSRAQVIEMAVAAVSQVKQLTKAQPETQWQLEYSPETFSATELDFSLEICNAVTQAWGATPNDKVILNLPATVEVATPNVYADQIEWMHRHLDRRDAVILSLHTHNDRGTAIAAAELGLMAGGERIEGCLFGNGERTGNVDLVTLAMNLYTQGIPSGLDFSDINRVADTVMRCNQLPVHPRHPYAGDLVFTAFSGSHQDAIRKGFAAQKPDTRWNVPYLPLDPKDAGRNYDSVIRVNSQSGKGGIAYLMETEYGVKMPRRLQVEFSSVVQKHVDNLGGEINAAQIWQIFQREYLDAAAPVTYRQHHLIETDVLQGIKLDVQIDGIAHVLTGEGNGPIDAAVVALKSIGTNVGVRSYDESAMSASEGDARACAFIELTHENGCQYGVGIDENIVTAAIKAIISGINRNRATHDCAP